MRKYVFLIVAPLVFAGAAVAHQGATGVVKARMDGMGTVQSAMKVVGGMARGRIEFDADAAQAALADMAEAARQIPELFEEKDLSDPSEALSGIWDNWDDFTAKADALAVAADVTVADLDALRAAMGPIGNSCSACHQDYRQK